MKPKQKYRHSEETKEKIRQSCLGKKCSDQHKRAISNSTKGRPKHPGFGQKVSQGLRHSKKFRRAMIKQRGKGNPMFGKHHSEETRQIISQKAKERIQQFGNPHIGKKQSESTKRKMRAAWKRRKLIPISDETRKKLSASRQGAKNPFYGKHHSIKTRDKIVASNHRRKGKWNRPPTTDTTKQKMSESAKKRVQRIGPPSLGKIFSEESRKRMSESHKGEKSIFWKGGIGIHYGSGWGFIKTNIRRRDNHQCQKCGTHVFPKTFHIPDVHHIVRFNTSHDNSLSNLITLCRKCHRWSDIHPQESIPFLQDILKQKYAYIY